MSAERVAVALSGGVDSAVAAAMLVQTGHSVIGIHGKEWSGTWAGRCPGAADADAARSVADHLGIPFRIVNCERAYREDVFRTLLSELAAGRTPNPDALCNQRIKFGVLADAARAAGATALATGHYAQRVERAGRVELRLSRDLLKDQTFFLSTLSAEQVSMARFPLGPFTKVNVRDLAREWRIPVAERAESMGLCFVGPDSFRAFIQGFLPNQPGSITDANGAVLGNHPGAHLYTIGQRHGLGLPGGPYYVAAKDVAQRTVTVVRGRTHPNLFSRSVRLIDPHWVNGEPTLPLRVRVRYRHQQPLLPATLVRKGRGVWVRFTKPAWAVAPGQLLMVVQGRTVLGGGTMIAPSP